MTGVGHRARRREPRASRRARRAGRPRRGHELEVLEDGPRRAALPPAARVPPRLREPPRAPAAAWRTRRTSCGPCRSSSRCSAATAWSSKTVARGYRTALWLYDATGGVRIGKRHKRLSQEEVLADVPDLDVDRLVAGFRYWDARGDDARLVLALARTAADQLRRGHRHARRGSTGGHPRRRGPRARRGGDADGAGRDRRALHGGRARRRQRDRRVGRRGRRRSTRARAVHDA